MRTINGYKLKDISSEGILLARVNAFSIPLTHLMHVPNRMSIKTTAFFMNNNQFALLF